MSAWAISFLLSLKGILTEVDAICLGVGVVSSSLCVELRSSWRIHVSLSYGFPLFRFVCCSLSSTGEIN
jgi:hypothetical protein